MDDPKALIVKYNKIAASKTKDYINPNTMVGQDKFRELAIKGIGLKGLAASVNGYAPILQIVKAKFSSGFTAKYNLDKLNIKELVKKYGEKNLVKEGNYVTVTHTNIAHNLDGTYTNINGDITTDHLAQMLAMIVDIIKEGVPNNINEYTYNTFAAMVLTGIPIEYAGMFISQPVIRKLANASMKSGGIIADKTRIIEDTKRYYQIRLLRTLLKQGKLDEKYLVKQAEEFRGQPRGIFTYNEKSKEWEYNGKDNQFYLYRADTEALLKYNPDEFITLSQEELEEQIKLGVTAAESNLDGLENLYRTQLQLLENWNGGKKIGYKKLGDGLGDVIRLLATDKLGADLNDTSAYKELYNKIDRNDRIVIEDSGEFVNVNRLVSDLSDKYKTVKSFLVNSNEAAEQLYSPLFIQQSKLFKRAVTHVLEGATLNDVNKKVAEDFLTKLMYLDLPYLYNFSKNTVLGINATPQLKRLNALSDISIEDFKNLSTANQLYYVKQFEKFDNTSLLNYLNYELDDYNRDRKKIHNVVFDKPKASDNLDNTLLQSFSDMLFSDNAYIKTLAENLVAYDLFTAGGTYNANSWNHLIPIEYLENKMNMSEYLYHKQNTANNTQFRGVSSDTDNVFGVVNSNLRELFVVNNANNINIVPKLSKLDNLNNDLESDSTIISIAKISQLGIKTSNVIYFTHNTIVEGKDGKFVVNKLYKGVKEYDADDKPKNYVVFEISKKGGKYIGIGMMENYVLPSTITDTDVYAAKMKDENAGTIDENLDNKCY